MANVKFNVDVVDSDSQVRYVASDEFVEVSDAFAKRLASHPAHGESFEVKGLDTSAADKKALQAKYFEIFGVKPGNKSVDTMNAEIEAHEEQD